MKKFLISVGILIVAAGACVWYNFNFVSQLAKCYIGDSAFYCKALGDSYMFLSNNITISDLRKATWFYKRHCKAKDSSNCNEIAIFSLEYLKHNKISTNQLEPSDRQNLENALNLMHKSCIDDNDYYKCIKLQEIYSSNIESFASQQKAKIYYDKKLEIYTKNCKENSLNCEGIAEIYFKGDKYTQKSPQIAVEFFHKHCDSKYGENSCLKLAKIYENGYFDIPRSYEKALQTYQKACESNRLGSCYLLGKFYEKNQEKAKAKEIFIKDKENLIKICDDGSDVRCWMLAKLYEDGYYEDSKSLELAEKIYLISYKRGNSESIVCLKNLYEKSGKSNEEINKNYENLIFNYEKRCQNGDIYDCIDLAKFYEIADKLPQSKENLKRVYKKSCELGDGFACAYLKYNP